MLEGSVSDGLDVVVVGAGIGGLGSALALARGGHRVTVVERDDTPMPDDVEGAFEWDRRGAPQVRHPHVFLGLARTILRDRFPDVLEALAALGVEAPVMRSGPLAAAFDEETLAVLAADDDLRMLPVRRTTFEWVMRRTVLAEPGVRLVVGRGVLGVVVRPVDGRAPVVTAVRLDDGSTVPADLVVATTGRRGDVPAWLAEHGVEVEETSSDSGVVYFSRFYRSAVDERFGFRGGFGAGLIAGVIGADAGTFSITAVVDKGDKELRAHLGDSARFDATMRLLPELADVAGVDAAPIHPVHCMTGLVNRTRTFTAPDGSPLVAGLVACGDAHTCTNPAYGRGQSLALRQAVLLAEALEVADGNVLEAARAYEAACRELVVPWYHFSVLTDQLRQAAIGSSGLRDGSVGPSMFDPSLLFGAGDPQTIRTAMRVFNLLDPPEAMIGLLPELQAAAAARPLRPAGRSVRRPTREELLGVVA
jgi:2-polyprenyl-6-methoxyphenol hydroxylase-like FAD-dependent oxidoreductase